MSDAYVFQAALLCCDCARAVLLEMHPRRDWLRQEHPEFPWTTNASSVGTETLCADVHKANGLTVGVETDTDRIPEGPHGNGGGEADSPQHCDNCGLLLGNPLTPDGVAYVNAAIVEWIVTGNGASVADWIVHYNPNPLDIIASAPLAVRTAIDANANAFGRFLKLADACRSGMNAAHGYTLPEAWEALADISGAGMARNGDDSISPEEADGFAQWIVDILGGDHENKTAAELAARFPHPFYCIETKG